MPFVSRPSPLPAPSDHSHRSVTPKGPTLKCPSNPLVVRLNCTYFNCCFLQACTCLLCPFCFDCRLLLLSCFDCRLQCCGGCCWFNDACHCCCLLLMLLPLIYVLAAATCFCCCCPCMLRGSGFHARPILLHLHNRAAADATGTVNRGAVQQEVKGNNDALHMDLPKNQITKQMPSSASSKRTLIDPSSSRTNIT